jgi:hypothetical protein
MTRITTSLLRVRRLVKPMAARLALWLCLALAAPYVLAQAEATVPKLAVGAIQAQANGRMEVRPDAHVPLFVEFDRSPALTQALVATLQAHCVRTTPDRSEAEAVLAIRSNVVLLGDPVFRKGTKVPMGEATEKTLAVAPTNRGYTAGDAANAAVTVALGAAALKSATTPFWSGLALGRMADALGDSTGIKGAFNNALTGDPRGICLSRCEDWKKVKQSAYAFATLTSSDGKQDIRVLATAFSETLAPEEVVGEALSKIQSSTDVRAAATKTP